MTFQTAFNPRSSRVSAQQNADGSFTQLVGMDSDWADAFGRLRVSDPFTLFESSFTYDLQPLLFEQVGTATHDTDSRSAIMSTNGTSGAVSALQSKAHLPYEKGKSQLVKVTFVLGAAVANVRRRAGYFDNANGFFVQQTGDGLSIVRRSSASGALVETAIPQASWNVDPLDGTGPSDVTLDVTKAQILVIDGQWLGVGRVRVGFNIDGLTFYAHEFLHANREPVAPYTQSFSLPIRWEIESTATSAAADLKAICCEVESEGGISSPNGLVFGAANTVDVATSTTEVHLISIRPAVDYPDESGQVNRTFVIPGEISVLIASQPCLARVLYDSVLTGGTWVRANPNSAIEVGIGQTLTTPGVPAEAFFAPAGSGNTRLSLSGSIDSQYPLSLAIDGTTSRALTIAVTTISGNGTARAAVNWKEIR